MLHLIHIEWLKLKRYNTFWIILAIFAILLVSWNWAIASGALRMGTDNMSILNSNYSFPAVWRNATYWTKTFLGLFSIIIIIITTNEYQFRTNRQHVIDGLTRQQFLHSKWLLIILLSIVVTLFTFIEGLALGLIKGSASDVFGDGFFSLIRLFFCCLNYLAFAFTLSLFTKKSGLTTILFLVYNYVIEVIIVQILKFRIPSHPGQYFPLQSSAEQFDLPLLDFIKQMTKVTTTTNFTLLYVSCGWIILYYFIGKWHLNRTDW